MEKTESLQYLKPKLTLWKHTEKTDPPTHKAEITTLQSHQKKRDPPMIFQTLGRASNTLSHRPLVDRAMLITSS